MSGIVRPRIFHTFFMKETFPSDQTSPLKLSGDNHLSHHKQVQGSVAISKYERDTSEFDTLTVRHSESTDDELRSAFTSVKNRYQVESEIIDDEISVAQKMHTHVHEPAHTPHYGMRLDHLRPELQKMICDNIDFMKEYIDLASGAWGEPVETDPMKYWLRKDPYYLVFRSEVHIDLPLDIVVRYMKDEEFMEKADVGRKDLKFLKIESPECCLLQYCIVARWPMSARDMVLYRNQYYSDNNNFQVLSFKAMDVDVPPPKGVVRLDMKVQGSTLTRIEPNKTRYINCSLLNPKVPGVPLFVMRSKMKEAAMMSYHFKEAVEAAERNSS